MGHYWKISISMMQGWGGSLEAIYSRMGYQEGGMGQEGCWIQHKEDTSISHAH
jgi:hypothetical protein